MWNELNKLAGSQCMALHSSVDIPTMCCVEEITKVIFLGHLVLYLNHGEIPFHLMNNISTNHSNDCHSRFGLNLTDVSATTTEIARIPRANVDK